MKRILILLMALVLAMSVLFISSCEKDTASGKEDPKETEIPADQIESDAKINAKDHLGTEKKIAVNFSTETKDYKVVRPEKASENLKNLAVSFREKVSEKVGLNIKITTAMMANNTDSAREINIGVDADLGSNDYSITSSGNRMLIYGGSEESLEIALDVFIKNFVYAKNNVFLIPLGNGLKYSSGYFLDKLTVDGVDMSEFKYYLTEDSIGGHIRVIRGDRAGQEFSELLSSKLTGYSIEKSTYRKNDEHYIIISSGSLNLKDYSIKVENGDLYISGSPHSILVAFDHLVSEIIGYTDGAAPSGKTVDLTSAINMEGKSDITFPYTKAELLAMMEKAYNDDNMIIAGTEAYGWGGNSKDIEEIAERFYNELGHYPAIIEVDVGEYSKFNQANEGHAYKFPDPAVARMVSEAAEHVANGGIVSIVMHLSNPLQNGSASFRGQIGLDDEFKKLYTPGTELNKMFLETIDETVRLAKALDDNGIPFLFRPFHEYTGDFFWWCIQQGSFGTLKADTWSGLWKYMYKHVTETVGIKNAVWTFAATPTNAMYAYPGDEYVDIVGVDWYTGGNKEVNNDGSYTALMKTGKPVALTEYGPGGNNRKVDVNGNEYYTYTSLDALNDFKWMIGEGMDIAYVLSWTGAGSFRGMGEGKAFFDDPMIYSRSELAELW